MSRLVTSSSSPGGRSLRRAFHHGLVAALLVFCGLPAATPALAAPGNEGFVAEPRVEPRARKVTRLADDPGRGEAVPRARVEATLGVWGSEGIPTNPGAAFTLAALLRPAGELWLGGGFSYRSLAGEDRYASLHDWSANLQARYYFMPHREANRFVMGYFLLQLGYTQLAAGGDDVQTRAKGMDFGLGVAVGTALSTRVYLGLQFLYTIPVWLKTCVGFSGAADACTNDPGDFTVSSWQLSLYVSRSF